MRLVTVAKNPVPGGAFVSMLRASDGAQLRFARWAATRGPRRGTVCLFGGRGECIEKYFEVIADLRRRGFAVATMDWRGQGGSERATLNQRKGHVQSFSEYDSDLKSFMRDVVLPDCPPPFIAVGHSMGGHVLLRNAARPGSWFDRIILSAPMIQLAADRLPCSEWLVRAYAESATLLGFGKWYVYGGSDVAEEQRPFEGNLLTSDRERWARNKAILDTEPALGIGAPTIGWLRAAMESMAMISDPTFPGRIQVPMLLFAAGKDKLVSPRAVEDFGASLKVGMPVLIPGAMHEILHEKDAMRQRFWAAFDAYLGIEETNVPSSMAV